MNVSMRKVWLAEFIGTFSLVFFGCGSIIAAEKGLLSSSYAAWIFGLTVFTMIVFFGKISNAHFNPAVSVGFLFLKKISFPQLLIYWSAEVGGAIFASLLHLLYFGSDHSFGANLPRVDLRATFGLEVLGTFFLMGVIAIIVTGKGFHKLIPPLSIGGTVALISFFIGPFSGGSFNPARTLGPALFSNNLDHLALYFIAPVIGSVVGAFLIAHLRKSN